MKNVENSIERHIEINAPVVKVWNALTDSKSFGQWFGANFHSKFVPGKTTKARNTSKGYEMDIEFHIQKINPQSYFSYKWTPFPFNQNFDYSKEEPTLVEFFLEEIEKGTLLKVKESGFSKVTASRRAEAFKMHSGGWEAQLNNIKDFLIDAK